MNTFFISDIHLKHKRLIEYSNLPFANVEEMTETLIANWNDKVGPQDMVFILGDLSFTNQETTAGIIKRLNHDKIILIRGNHDGRHDEWFQKVGISQIVHYPIIWDKRYILCHKPPEWREEVTPLKVLYGHVHNDEEYPTVGKNSICVCAERWNFTPISAKEVEDIFAKNAENKKHQ